MHVTAHLDVEAIALEQDDAVTVMLNLVAPELVGAAMATMFTS